MLRWIDIMAIMEGSLKERAILSTFGMTFPTYWPLSRMPIKSRRNQKNS